MALKAEANIVIKGAKTNNLKDLSIEVPNNKFILVTGVYGSGKSEAVKKNSYLGFIGNCIYLG